LTGWDGAVAWLIFTVSAIYQVTSSDSTRCNWFSVGNTLEATAYL